MSEALMSRCKFNRLLDYINKIGFDAEALAQRADLNLAKLTTLPEHAGIPAACYAKLYQATVAQMQQLGRAIPWGAGVGSDAFRLMCCSSISCKTLGEALQRAQQFDALV